MDRCEFYTKKGEECPYQSKTYNKQYKVNVCNMHDSVCNYQYKEYKNICNQVWTHEKLSTLSDAALNTLGINVAKCRDKRTEFVKNCCNYLDDKHYGAIQKMDRYLIKIEDEWNRRFKNSFNSLSTLSNKELNTLEKDIKEYASVEKKENYLNKIEKERNRRLNDMFS